MEHLTLSSRDGTPLAARRWRPGGEARGRVLLVHGLAEHIGRYVHVAEALAGQGHEVLGVELRGHGHSGGKRGHVDRWARYGDDLRAGLAELEGPGFVLAHSMGGLVSIDTLLDAPDPKVLGVALSNPLLGLAFTPPRVKALAGRLLSRVLPSLSLKNELDSSRLSRDPGVARKYLADPLVYDTITPRWFTESTRAMSRAHARAPSFTLPMLMLLGDADGLTDHQAGQRFFDAAGSHDKRCHVYPGFYHELFNEPEKAQVIGDLTAWLAERT